jgi:hypothetical protein
MIETLRPCTCGARQMCQCDPDKVEERVVATLAPVACRLCGALTPCTNALCMHPQSSNACVTQTLKNALRHATNPQIAKSEDCPACGNDLPDGCSLPDCGMRNHDDGC